MHLAVTLVTAFGSSDRIRRRACGDESDTQICVQTLWRSDHAARHVHTWGHQKGGIKNRYVGLGQWCFPLNKLFMIIEGKVLNI